MNILVKHLRFAIVLVFPLLLVTCKYPSEPVRPNAEPQTRLSNLPPDDPIAFYIRQNSLPEISLSWIGDDADGYIIGYKYRWRSIVRGNVIDTQPWRRMLSITRVGWENVVGVTGSPASVFRIYNFLVTLGDQDTGLVRQIGDSLETERSFAVPYKTGIVVGDSIIGVNRQVLQTPTTGTFIFSSPIDSNRHSFEVSSIDNSDFEDSSPAVVNFWTIQSPSLVCKIQAPVGQQAVPAPNSLCIRNPTERFRGLRFKFSSDDPNNTQDITYSWAVDDRTRWTQWSQADSALVTASMFIPIVSGTHRFYVRAKNRWGVISPTVDTAFTAVIPDFDNPGYQPRILVINSTPPILPLAQGFGGGIDTAVVKSFYTEIMDSAGRVGKYDVLTLAPSPSTRFPNDVTIGKYSLVIWAMEADLPTLGLAATYRLSGAQQAILSRYLLVGGKLIMIGVMDVVNGVQNWVSLQGSRGWAEEPLHIVTPNPVAQNTARDFKGSRGANGYPDIAIDPTRLPADSTGTIRNISLGYPRPLAQAISTFDSESNNPNFENQPIGVRYLGPDNTTYSTVYFGFPLFYAQKSATIQAIRKALSDVNH